MWHNGTEWRFRATAKLTISCKVNIDTYQDKETVSLFWIPIEKSHPLLVFKNSLCIWKSLIKGIKLSVLSTGSMGSTLLRTINEDWKIIQKQQSMQNRAAFWERRCGDKCEFQVVSTNHFSHTIIQVRQPVGLAFWPY